MKIYWEKLLPTLLVLVLSILSGRYLGEEYLFFFRAIIILLAGDLFLFFLGWINLRYNQHFSNEHVDRGDTLSYDFYVQQPSWMCANRIRLEFHRIRLAEGLYPEEMELFLRKTEKQGNEYTIQAQHRGIYEAGIRKITLFDFLGLWEVPLILFPRTFYIYPRIYNPDKSAPEGLSPQGEKESMEQAGTDQTFRSLKEYRPGMDLRGISWKHFARMGRPLIREQGVTTSNNRIILLDRRPLPREREDLLLENALAYINSCRGGRDPIRLAGFIPGKLLTLQSESDWQSLIKGTLTLNFDAPAFSDLNLSEEDPLTLVSALPDGSLLEPEFWRSHSRWQLMALMEGMEREEKIRKMARLESLKLQGVDVIVIEKGEEFWSAG